MQDLRGQSVKGYDLWECIGEGGYSAVYKAYQAATGREVAIKIIRDEIANKPEFIRSFESETRLVARLEHPYIVPLIDFWRDPGGAYLVMRLLRGGNLHDAIQGSKFSLERILGLLDQITSALELAHRNQIIHGDIKPPNILLDEDGNAYLSDFRIVKNAHWQDDGDQPITGSPDYMSPEQVLKAEPSPLSDIYSLGIVLYEMLSGERPFYTGLSIEERKKILDKPLP